MDPDDLIAFDTAAWMGDAACRGLDPNLFHPVRGEDTSPARTVCADCPVRPNCLGYALDIYRIPGIWGGTSQRERRALHRRIRLGADRATVIAHAATILAAECANPSNSRYVTHRRRGEEACAGCIDARREYNRNRRKQVAA